MCVKNKFMDLVTRLDRLEKQLEIERKERQQWQDLYYRDLESCKGLILTAHQHTMNCDSKHTFGSLTSLVNELVKKQEGIDKEFSELRDKVENEKRESGKVKRSLMECRQELAQGVKRVDNVYSVLDAVVRAVRQELNDNFKEVEGISRDGLEEMMRWRSSCVARVAQIGAEVRMVGEKCEGFKEFCRGVEDKVGEMIRVERVNAAAKEMDRDQRLERIDTSLANFIVSDKERERIVEKQAMKIKHFEQQERCKSHEIGRLVEEFTIHVEELKSGFKSVKNEIQSVSEYAGQIDSRVAEGEALVEEKLFEVGEVVDGLRGKVSQIEVKVSEMGESLQVVESDGKETAGKVDSLTVGIGTFRDKMGAQNCTADLETMKSWQRKLQNEFVELRLALQQKVMLADMFHRSASEKLQLQSRSISLLTARLDNYEQESIQRLKVMEESMHEYILDIQSEMQRMAAGVCNLQNNLFAINSSTATDLKNDERLDELNVGFANLESKCNSSETKLKSIEKSFGQIQSAVDFLIENANLQDAKKLNVDIAMLTEKIERFKKDIFLLKDKQDNDATRSVNSNPKVSTTEFRLVPANGILSPPHLDFNL